MSASSVVCAKEAVASFDFGSLNVGGVVLCLWMLVELKAILSKVRTQQ